jgi:hypothetical protein
MEVIRTEKHPLSTYSGIAVRAFPPLENTIGERT